MLDNLTEKFGIFKKKKDPVKLVKDYYIPHCKNGQWYYGYEKVYMRRYPACTFPLYNGRIDTSNTENYHE